MIRALVFMLTGEYEKAVEEYNILLARVLADEPWYYYQRATPEWILGRHEDALEDYRRVREQLGRPSYGDARRFLILRHEGRHDEAKEVLDAALGKLDDMVGFAWLEQICKCLDGQITPEKLIEEAEGGTNPEHECEAYYYAAEFCLLKGRQDEAEHWFRKCVETDLILDPNAGVIMNEWELARWRLSTLFADAEAPTPEKN